MLVLVPLVNQHLLGDLERALPVGREQQPVLPPVHHEPHDSEGEHESDVAEERPDGGLFVAGDEHLVLLAIVQDVVHGRLGRLGEEFDQGRVTFRVVFFLDAAVGGANCGRHL